MLDGIDEGAPVLGKFCGYEVTDSVFTTGNVLTIQYHAAYYLPGSFYLHWAAVNESGARSSHGMILVITQTRYLIGKGTLVKCFDNL